MEKTGPTGHCNALFPDPVRFASLTQSPDLNSHSDASSHTTSEDWQDSGPFFKLLLHRHVLQSIFAVSVFISLLPYLKLPVASIAAPWHTHMLYTFLHTHTHMHTFHKVLCPDYLPPCYLIPSRLRTSREQKLCLACVNSLHRTDSR